MLNLLKKEGDGEKLFFERRFQGEAWGAGLRTGREVFNFIICRGWVAGEAGGVQLREGNGWAVWDLFGLRARDEQDAYLPVSTCTLYSSPSCSPD
jgi:hypothetical protein